MTIEVTINGARRSLEVEPGELLLDVLRRAGFRGVKFGCGEGDCGACTVLLDGQPINSCLVLAARVAGHEITTIEGLGTVHEPNPLQRAYAEEGAVQCGYCIPGSILSSHALLERDPEPGDSAILRALDGNLCRCTGYAKKLTAIRRVARERREGRDE
jgi:aerobic-type carbon monoxide dehydrogenase small subunit (CoxS/CutS family)